MSLSGETPSQVQLHNEIAAESSSSSSATGKQRQQQQQNVSSSSHSTTTTTSVVTTTTTAVTSPPSGSDNSRTRRRSSGGVGVGGTCLSTTTTTAATSSSIPSSSSTRVTGPTTTTEREDEISTASPSRSPNTKAHHHHHPPTKVSNVGQEGLTGDIGQIEDVTSIQPGSNVTRVYKKCASNGSLAVYVGTRTLTVTGTHLEPLKGVLVFDHESLAQQISNDYRIWGQITLTFRYGREDEEVLGLRFCNEAILALKQLWPPMSRDPEDENDEDEELTPLQTVLLERVRSSATTDSIKSVPFVLCGGPVGLGSFPPPPSVLLAPAKPYRGSPIGTIYDLRIYASLNPEERPPRRNLIRLALRAVQMPCTNVPFDLNASLEARPTFLSRGKIRFHCELNKNAVRYGEPLEVMVVVQNNSRSSIRRVLVSLIQQVDVCMFTSGKFKNTVGCADDTVLIVPGASLSKRYTLIPTRGPARQWLALEEAFGRDPVLAPSTIIDNLFGKIVVASPQRGSMRNVFAIIVSYYVKVKLVLGGLSLGQCVKVPFVLLPPENAEPDPYPEPDGANCTGAGGQQQSGGNPQEIVGESEEEPGPGGAVQISTVSVSSGGAGTAGGGSSITPGITALSLATTSVKVTVENEGFSTTTASSSSPPPSAASIATTARESPHRTNTTTFFSSSSSSSTATATTTANAAATVENPVEPGGTASASPDFPRNRKINS